MFVDLLDEDLPPHEVKRLYIHGNEHPDTWVDIADTLHLKLRALAKHSSQGDTHGVEKMIEEWAAEEGKLKGLQAAEAYRVMILQGEEDHPQA